jgi:hypothetical protein
MAYPIFEALEAENGGLFFSGNNVLDLKWYSV